MSSAETAPRETVGSLLRTTRAGLGVDLPHVAEALRIRLTFLQAIEEGRNQDLPGPTYAVGFVRAYAEYLGLDGEEIIRRYKAETSIVPRKADLEFPTPVNEGGIPTGAMLLVAALLGAGIYGGWYWMSSEDRTVAELIQEVPERFNSLVSSAPEAGEEGAAVVEALAQTADRMLTEEGPEAGTAAESVATPETPAADTPAPVAEAPEPEGRAPAASPVEEPASVAGDTSTEPAETVASPAPEQAAPQAPVESPVAEAPAEPEPEAQPEIAPEAPPEVVAEPEPQPEPEEAQELAAVPAAPDLPEPIADLNGAVYGAPAGSTRVVLAATQDSWIQVRAGDDLIATRLLREGERFQVPDRNGLTLMVGNAAGLRIVVDGRTLPPLGNAGEVRRGIRLAPEALLAN
jgi:cytoskeletal protein RodZ